MLAQANAGLLDAAARCAVAEKSAAESEGGRAHASQQVTCRRLKLRNAIRGVSCAAQLQQMLRDSEEARRVFNVVSRALRDSVISFLFFLFCFMRCHLVL